MLLNYIQYEVGNMKMDLSMLESLLCKRLLNYQCINDVQIDTGDLKFYSRVSRFLMSLIACGFPPFVDVYLKGELKIFMHMLKKRSCSEVVEELSILLLNMKYLAKLEDVGRLSEKELEMWQLVLNTMSKLIENGLHVFADSHTNNCEEKIIVLPFTFLPSLVSSREAEVTRGNIHLPCGRWQEILNVAYTSFLSLELKLVNKCKPLKRVIYQLEDDRLRQVIKRFTNHLRGRKLEGSNGTIHAVDVDSIAKYFPPCMANLHQILRRTHRLSYESRYQYTLFLKDIGMSLEENIVFWESEYKKPCHGSSCSHEWISRGNRYKYQIEHMYGMIGNSHVKTSHSCIKFIEKLQSKMDSGCPFQHFTEDDLRDSIPKGMLSVPDVEDVFNYKNCGLPQRACSVYLSCQTQILNSRTRGRHERLIKTPAYILSPLQYFNFAKNIAETFHE